MADLGPGEHSLGEIARQLGATSEIFGSVRQQLIKKDIAFSPSSGMLEFRIPLTERYIQQNRDALQRRAAEYTHEPRSRR